MQQADLEVVCTFDLAAFGADRSHFLRWRLDRYPQCCKVLVENGMLLGFIQGKTSPGWAVAGPWVIVEGTHKPERLLESLASETGETPLSLGVLESNEAALALIRSLGLSEGVDSPWRMSMGPSRELGANPACYTNGSPAKG